MRLIKSYKFDRVNLKIYQANKDIDAEGLFIPHTRENHLLPVIVIAKDQLFKEVYKNHWKAYREVATYHELLHFSYSNSGLNHIFNLDCKDEHTFIYPLESYFLKFGMKTGVWK